MNERFEVVMVYVGAAAFVYALLWLVWKVS